MIETTPALAFDIFYGNRASRYFPMAPNTFCSRLEPVPIGSLRIAFSCSAIIRKSPSHRLVRDVGVEIGILFVEQAELGGLPGVLVVLAGEVHLGGGPLHDRQELRADGLGRRAPEVLRRRVGRRR